ncbi:MFS transporter [Ferroacidibacillus organovorans]|nr:MFS transporter [Ferroacidibacillus organovorans]
MDTMLLQPQHSHSPLTKRVVFVLALVSGVTVANLYYNQPLLAQIVHTFHATAQQGGILSMCTQIGYAIGLFFFVPLGDMKERRRLILILLIVVALFLVGIATAQNMAWMDAASLAVGVTSIAPQLLIPLAAQLAAPHERGKVIGSVMSGLLIGILLARTASGWIGGDFGWRTMYWIAALMMVILSVLLRLLLPQTFPEQTVTYRELFVSVGRLIREQPTLRETSLLGATLFGGFSLFWTTLTFFIEQAPYHYGSQIAGLFGLVGVVGAVAARFAGRLADRMPAQILSGFALTTVLLSFLCFWIFGYHLVGLILGIVLLDLGTQAGHILNQSRIFNLLPEARNRLNMVYMVAYFLGGSISSAIGSFVWTAWRWNGVCAFGCVLVATGFSVWGTYRVKSLNAASANDESST